MVATIGGPDEVLADEALVAFISRELGALPLDGRSVCLVIPDGTRSCPLPLLMDAVHAALAGRVSRMTAVIALGTHQAMSDREIAAHLTGDPGGDVTVRYPGLHVENHAWWEPATFVDLGTIPASRLSELSAGRIDREVVVRINRAAVEHDVVLIVGPVFPHEVVGFSGGAKYLFPGISGKEVIDVSHWLGALVGSINIIGTPGITPVRALIHEAAAHLPNEVLALCIVVESGTHHVHSAALGAVNDAWAAAAEVSAGTHVRYLPAPVERVLARIPTKYADMWTAAKGMYKAEPVVADGGEVVIWAPHVRDFAVSHPEMESIGYHCLPYFTEQWDRFRDMPGGLLAHSTHLRGAGTYDTIGGERCRIRVTLATGIPEERVRAAGLDYLDPASVDPADFAGPGSLYIENAGEVLYRLA